MKVTLDLNPAQIFELVENKHCVICFQDKKDGDCYCDGYTNFIIVKSRETPRHSLTYPHVRDMKIRDDKDGGIVSAVIYSTNEIDDCELSAIQKNPLSFIDLDVNGLK